MRECPFCRALVRVDSLQCPTCREYLTCRYCGRDAFYSQRPPRDRAGFGSHLIERRLATVEQILAGLDRQQALRPPLGLLARDRGMLDAYQVLTILNAQVVNERSFGQAAIELGMLSEPDVQALTKAQRTSGPRLGELLLQARVLNRAVLDRELERYESTELSDGNLAPPPATDTSDGRGDPGHNS